MGNLTDSLVLCGDIECYQSIATFNPTINAQLISGHPTLSTVKQFATFGSSVYKHMINERNNIMRNLFMDLYNNYNTIYDGVFFMDSDIVITNNFLPLIKEKYL